MIYSVWEWKARKGNKKASRFREALHDRVRFLLLPLGEARRPMRVLDFCGRSAYNEITKEDRVPNFWTHEQTESPLGTANTEGASCLPGVSVCRAGGSTRGPRLLRCFGFFAASPSQALTRQLSQGESQGPAGKFLPLPLGEVSPQVTERASPLPGFSPSFSLRPASAGRSTCSSFWCR